MPPSASTNRPRRARSAPVKAPRAWPNSSLSSSASGIAPQFTATKAWWRRPDCAWIARASTSLPVPLSPVSSTVALYSAARSSSSSRSIIPGDAATIGRSPTARLDVALEQGVRAAQPLALPGLLDREQHLGGLEGLGQVVEGAALEGLDREVAGAVGGHQQDGSAGQAADQLGQQLEAVHAGHAHVAEHDVHGRLEAGEGGRRVGGRHHLVALGREQQAPGSRAGPRRRPRPGCGPTKHTPRASRIGTPPASCVLAPLAARPGAAEPRFAREARSARSEPGREPRGDGRHGFRRAAGLLPAQVAPRARR